jgi:multiple sugar transport system substrate-binding protein
MTGCTEFQKHNDPESIVIWASSMRQQALDEFDLQDDFVSPIQEHFPDLTVRLEQSAFLKEYLDRGEVPDLILDEQMPWYTPQWLEEQLLYDLNDGVKKSKMDLSVMTPGILEQIKSYGENNQLLALPFSKSMHALAYNKDIFDRFQVPYPKDHMTWNQIFELADRVTGTIQNQKYVGLHLSIVTSYEIMNQLTLSFFSDHSENVDLSGWKPFFDFWQMASTHSTSGLLQGNLSPSVIPQNSAMFLTDGVHLPERGNYDFVSYPTFDFAPGVGPDFVNQTLSIHPKSPNKEIAFKVMTYLMSDDYQSSKVKKGVGSPIGSRNVSDAFVQNDATEKGKHLEAFFINKPAVPPAHINRYDRNHFDQTGNLPSVNIPSMLIQTATHAVDTKSAMDRMTEMVRVRVAYLKAVGDM